MAYSPPGSVEIRIIDFKQTIPLRSALLRPGKPLDEVLFPGDDHEDSFHLGAFPTGSSTRPDSKPLAVASFHPNRHPDFPETLQYQLRGMATDPAHQGKGLGRELIRFALSYLKERGVNLLWCNAREDAIPFYLKTGFRETGPLFMIPDVCLHRVMYISTEQ